MFQLYAQKSKKEKIKPTIKLALEVMQVSHTQIKKENPWDMIYWFEIKQDFTLIIRCWLNSHLELRL